MSSGDGVSVPAVEGVRHHFVEVAGARFHVAESGPEDGEPILLLHGWPEHWYAWRKVIPQLAVDRRVICPDLRGFGWSDATPGRYDKQSLADDMLALLDALGIERVDLIGHDWGAWIGFLLCLNDPGRFKHYLALNMYTPWPPPPSPRALIALARLWYQALLAAPGFGRFIVRRTKFVRRLITTGVVQPEPWTEEDLECYSAVLREPSRAKASVRLYRTFLLREFGPYLAGKHKGRHLTVPTLMLHGTRDLAIDHRALGDWQSHAAKMAVELRDDSGHFINEELPDLVASRARALFSDEYELRGQTEEGA